MRQTRVLNKTQAEKMNQTRELFLKNTSNQIEQIASEQKEIARNQIAYITHFKAYLKNIPTPSMYTPFGRNTAKKIYILTTDQSADTNRTRM